MKKNFSIFVPTVVAFLFIGATLIVPGVLRAVSCTNNFPTSLNSYSTLTCVASAWANALEAKIGIDGSAVATSLDYLIKSTSSKLGKIASLAVTDGNFIVSDGTNWTAESGATARTSLGLGSSDAVTFGTLDTGQGANELYDMDQNLLTSVSPSFLGAFLTATGVSGGAVIGGDVQIYRGAANRLDLASGDSLSIVNGTVYLGSGGVIDFATGDVTLTHSSNLLTITGGAVAMDSLTLTTPLDIGDDTNLTAGRSLTLTGDDVAADAELYTDSKTLYVTSPTNSDIFRSIWYAPVASTITSISCESDQTVVFDLYVDDGSPAAVNGSNITCTTFATDSTLAGDATMAAGDRLDAQITTVSGTPGFVSIIWSFIKDD